MTGVEDLVQWLPAQLDQEEQTARNAMEHGNGEWTFVDTQGGDHKVVDSGGYTITGHYDVDAQPWFAEPHIAEWDPARVLREIDAKRQLLDDYEVTARIRDEAAARIKAAGDHPDPKDLDTWDRAQREAAILEGPVKLAASPLSDRPGFREEWRP